MTIDKNQLEQAKNWARGVISNGSFNPESRSAAEVIQSLPDEIVDGDRLREIIDWRDSKPSGDDYDGEFYERIRALLPAPAPRAEIKLGGWAMHPDYGKVLICSARVEPAGEVQVMWLGEDNSDGTCATHVLAADLSPVPSATPTDQDVTVPGMWTEPDHSPLEDMKAAVKKLKESEDKPQPGESWATESLGTVRNMIRTEDGWMGQYGSYSDKYSPKNPLHRLVPEQQPRQLESEDDFSDAPIGTIAWTQLEDGDVDIARKVSAGQWRSTYTRARHSHEGMADSYNPWTVL